ncbi:MAG: serine/threonine protein kinase [Oscillospiraceae bacterium]|nr:serine/threonine protein kinase [Oscillospiraceae bacterium]
MYGSKLEQSYYIETKLGSGASGAVYKAWHKRLRKHIVIKELKDSTLRAIEVHRNEIEALKNVKSLYVPQVFDFLMEDKSSYTVMEYIEGDSLDKILKLGRMFSETQIVKWYYQLAGALEAIHKQNVCHRDIKPANIMLMPDGDVCLIDFNAAFVSGNNTKIVHRSLGYASPEQYLYFKFCDDINRANTLCVAEPQPIYVRKSEINQIDWKLSDIYSLGATMFHLITGKRPPISADDEAVAINLGSELGEVAKIVQRCMRKKPENRFPTACDLRKSIYPLM